MFVNSVSSFRFLLFFIFLTGVSFPAEAGWYKASPGKEISLPNIAALTNKAVCIRSAKGQFVNVNRISVPGGMADRDINGRNVKFVEFGTKSKKLGVFTQVSQSKRWEKRDSKGKLSKYSETNRDEWSVYLRDNSRGVNIQLDLWTKKIFYSDKKSKRRQIYVLRDGRRRYEIFYNVTATSKKCGPQETFIIRSNTIQNMHWKTYLSCRPDGRLEGGIKNPSSSEQIKVIGPRRDKYVLRCMAHGKKFLVAMYGGGKELRADRPKTNTWETFRIEPAGAAARAAAYKDAAAREKKRKADAAARAKAAVVREKKRKADAAARAKAAAAWEKKRKAAAAVREKKRRAAALAAIKNKSVCIRSAKGQFVVVEDNQKNVTATSKKCGPREAFIIRGNTIQNMHWKTYLSCRPDGRLEGGIKKPSSSEQIEVIELRRDKYALRCMAHGKKFLVAMYGGGKELRADRRKVGGWETFRVVPR
jgi:hypothetical protein